MDEFATTRFSRTCGDTSSRRGPAVAAELVEPLVATGEPVRRA